ERQLDDHVRGENCLWTQWSGTQPLENSPFAVDRDDGDQRYHRADRNQERSEHRQTHAEETAGGQRWCWEVAAGHSTDHQEHQDGETNGPERAERLAHEDLDFNPSE